MSLDPELQQIIDAWAAEAGPPAHEVAVEQARRAHLAETEHLAGEGPAVARVCDDTAAGVPVRVYEPEDADGTIAYLHGGGWVLGSRRVRRRRLSRARERGARPRRHIDYRLAPEHPFPAAVDDAALDADRGAASTADVVAGDSAGGNLAAVVARHLKDRRSGSSCWSIPSPTPASTRRPTATSTALRPHRGRDAALLEPLPARRRRPRPGRLAAARARTSSGLPPAYVLTASHDVLRDEGEAYAARAARTPASR